MLNALLRGIAKFLVWLRYRVRVVGLDAVAARGTSGIVFFPNHPALIDPIIVMSLLNRRFAPRALADQDQIDRPVVRLFARRAGVIPFPAIAKHGPAVRPQVEEAVGKAIESVRSGGNLVLYPAGHVYHSWLEDLRGNSGPHKVLREAPDARVVLVRTRGLWGSGFSWAAGRPPQVGTTLKRGAIALLLSGIFFAPRRPVTIEFVEPDDLPRDADRETINAYLERFYNADAPHNTHVPFSIWERGGIVELPEVEQPTMRGDVATVPEATRGIVARHLEDLTGRPDIQDDHHLARDLGLDSLARTELLVWVEGEFGFPQGDADALETVADVLLAACGETVASEFDSLKPVPSRWFAQVPGDPPLLHPTSDTITGAFLELARRRRNQAIIADQMRGAKTGRDLVLGILALRPAIAALDGQRVGIMLPASVVADVVYLATLFAGKTPVMVNWTVGSRYLLHSLDLAEVRHILTADALVARLAAQGTDLSALTDRFVSLEKIGREMSLATKLGAFIRSRLSWASLDRAPVSDTAAILFTSGSETLPKAVPLSHANMIEDLRSVLRHVALTQNDRMLGFLPPFHAFGITVTMLAPLCFGLRTVYHPNPTDGTVLGRLIEAYKATLLIGTPTFLNGILRSSSPQQLTSLRIAVTGAEKCPERVYDALEQACPAARVLEGYGVTECGPIVAVNSDADPRRGAIGSILDAFDHMLLHPDTAERLEPPATGILHVRGPCVFGGYLNYEGSSPFTDIDGETWYSTGDLVSEDADGIVTFRGRLKRFVKLGGEMVSLPAIEAVLEASYATEDAEGPVLAVEATAEEGRPELILFTTVDLARQEVNDALRDAGLSPLHNIRRVIRLETIPVLGTGKTDYRALKATLAP